MPHLLNERRGELLNNMAITETWPLQIHTGMTLADGAVEMLFSQTAWRVHGRLANCWVEMMTSPVVLRALPTVAKESGTTALFRPNMLEAAL